jgi:hypothetical protein
VTARNSNTAPTPSLLHACITNSYTSEDVTCTVKYVRGRESTVSKIRVQCNGT